VFLCNKLFRTVGAYFDFFTKHFLVFLFSGALPMVRGTTHSLGVGGYPNENGHPSGLPITPPLGSLKNYSICQLVPFVERLDFSSTLPVSWG